MQNEIKVFGNDDFNVKVMVDEYGNYQFDAESVAISLGLTTVAKSGNVCVRWKRVNEYLKLFGTSAEVAKGSYIPEPGVYKLAFKANNEVAENFQDCLAMEVLPALRKTGTYSVTTTCQYPVSAAAIESATNAGRLFERIMKSEGIPPHEIAMAVRDIFLQAGINVPDYVVRIPAYEQLAMTFGKSGEVACS